MRFVFAADDNYAMPLGVALQSLREHSGTEAGAAVLSDGIGAENRARLKHSWPGLEFFDVGAMLPNDLPLGGGYLSRSTYARLWAPEVLGDERLVYLDCDLIVTDDLTPLFDWPLKGATLAAARDVDSPVASCPGGLTSWQEAGVDPRLPLYNAGVLVIDSRAWTERESARRVLDYVRTRPGIAWADQEGICVALSEEIEPLPLRWNAQPPLRRTAHLGYAFFDPVEVDEAVNHPAVIHFAEGAKPWHSMAPDTATSLWRDVITRTAWSSWTPPKPPSVLDRAQARLRQASRS